MAASAVGEAGSGSAAAASAGAERAGAGEEDRRVRRAGAVLLCAAALAGCGYNQMVAKRESIESAWAQVENQLQRRNDLIPNLVEVTKGYATHEREIFEQIA